MACPFDEKDPRPKEEKGYLVLRIINPGEGKIFNGIYESGELIDNFPTIKTNSKISFSCVPFCFSPYVIHNSKAPVQLLIIKNKRGTYAISNIGK